MWDYQYGELKMFPSGSITIDKCVSVDIVDCGEMELLVAFQLSEANNKAWFKLIIWYPP